MAIPQEQHHWHHPEVHTPPPVTEIEPELVVVRDYRGLAIAMALLGLLIVTGVFGWLLASGEDDAAVQDPGVSIAAIAAGPETYLGRQVDVRGEVGDFVSTGLFTIGARDAGADVLVWADPDVTPLDAIEGRIVDVSGEVRMVDEAFIEDFGPFDEAADIREGTVVIVASDVEVIAVS